MVKISEQKMAMTNSFLMFGGIFAHFLLDILTKHNIKETASKGIIGGPWYIPNGEGLGDS